MSMRVFLTGGTGVIGGPPGWPCPPVRYTRPISNICHAIRYVEDAVLELT
jgi:hypothetical protein